jgi:hypothetical protein
MRTFIFLDLLSFVEDLDGAHSGEVDFEALTDYLVSPSEGRFLLNSYVFHGVHPDSPYIHQAAVNKLRRLGYVGHPIDGVRDGDGIRYPYEIPMTIQLLHVNTTMKPDVMILVSSNPGLIPVVDHLKQQGTRVEVASVHPSSLASHGSGYISLEMTEDDEDEPSEPQDGSEEIAPDERQEGEGQQ